MRLLLCSSDQKPQLLLLARLLLLLLMLLPSASSSIPSDAVYLLAFKNRADPNDRLNFTTTNSRGTGRSSSSTGGSLATHCLWQGVQCSAEGRVTKLVLENLGLAGVFADRTLSSLHQLRVLSLQNNSLAGSIPDLSPLSNLKTLFLDHNAFSGSFPLSLLSLARIRTLDLSRNNLSGTVPPALAGLDRLYSLRLDGNRFNGSIPPFNQTSIKTFNISCNSFSGPIPATFVLLAFDASVFSGNPGLCGKALHKECRPGDFFDPATNNNDSSSPSALTPGAGGGGQLEGMLLMDSSSSSRDRRRMHKTAAIAAGIVGGTVLLVVGFSGVILAATRKRCTMHTRLPSPQKGSAAAPTTMDAVEMVDSGVIIAQSTDNRSRSSNGNNGGSRELAVAASMPEEQVKKMGKSGCLVFCSGEAPIYTIEQLMKASAELLGRGTVGATYKAVLDNQLIVSVKRIDAGRMAMTGKEAFQRHMEIAGRLRHPNLVPLRAYFQAKEERLLVYDYQHNGSLFNLIHGTRSTHARPLHWTSCLKIAEDVAQGLAYIHQTSRLVHGNLKSANVLLGSDYEACLTDNCLAFLVEPSAVEEESGYRAPEAWNSNRRLTTKSDIYAFGTLLLELLTGKPPLPHRFLVATDLPVWVCSIREEEGLEHERLMMLVDIASSCVRSSPESRPTTWQVLKMIQEVKEADMGDNDVDLTSSP